MDAAYDRTWSEDLRTATHEGLASLSALPTRDGAVAL